MAKRKKVKSTPNNHVLTGDRLYRDVISYAGRKDCYANMLCIKDATPIFEAEKKMSTLQRNIFRTILLCDSSKIPPHGAQHPRVSVRIMAMDMDTMVNIFASAVSNLISTMLKEVKPSDYDNETIYNEIGKFESSIPDEFYEESPTEQYKKHTLYQYGEPFTNAISDVIDWAKVIKGNDPTHWAENALKLIYTTLPSETREPYERKRISILNDIIELILKGIPRYLNKASRELLENGYTNETTELPKQTPIPGTKIENIPLVVNTNTPGIPLTPQTTQLLQPAKPWMTTFFALVMFMELDEQSDIYTALSEKYTMSEIAWAALVELACAAHTKRFGGIQEILLNCIIFIKYSTPKMIEFLDPKDTEEEIFLRTSVPRRLPKDIYEICRDDAEKFSSKTPKSTSVWQILAYNTKMWPPDILHIRTKWMPIIMQLGYSETQAAALCGYIEGCRMRYTHTLMTNVYVKDILKNIKNDAADEDKPDINEDMISEKMKALTESADKRIHMIRQQAARSEKEALHEKAEALRQVESYKAENERLLQELADLKQENKALFDLIAQSGSDTDTEETNVEFPCMIGNDIKIISYGGSEQWMAQLRGRFPNIRFFGPDVEPNYAAIAGADIVLVNTYVFKHKRYRTIQAAIRGTNKSICLYPNKGINTCTNYILDVYEKFRKDHPDRTDLPDEEAKEP